MGDLKTSKAKNSLNILYIFSIFFALILENLEWRNELAPSWMVFGDSVSHGIDFRELNKIWYFKLFEFKECIKASIMELTKESFRITLWKMFLLQIINSRVNVHFWLVFSCNWITDFLKVIVIWCKLQNFLQLCKLTNFVQSLCFSWVKLT